MAALSSRLLSTYFPVLVSAKMAPQKVNPKPTKAAICEPKGIETESETTPRAKNMVAILVAELFFFWVAFDRKFHLERSAKLL